MTDKLADAFTSAIDEHGYFENADGILYKLFSAKQCRAIKQILTAHEAAKAATPDDVREAVEAAHDYIQHRIDGEDEGVLDGYVDDGATFTFKHLQTLINAALRQGVTIDTMAELLYLRYCHECGVTGARWELNDSKDVWREKALLDQHARGG